VRRRPIALVAVWAVLGMLSVAGCSTPAPVASNAVPPPAQADQDPVVVWAALGGDETRPFDEAATPGSWSQLVLTRLPESAQLLNVATEDATLQVGGTSQLEALAASPLKPTIATVWFGSDEPNTPKGEFADALTDLVNGLEGMGVERVVLISRPDAPGDRRYRYGPEIQSVAAATGATAIEVTSLTRNPGQPEVQAAIADQLAPAIAAG
jgi:hypothetical protein